MIQHQNVKKYRSILFSNGRITENFFTEDSKLYITPKEQRMIESGYKLNRSVKKWDSLSSRIVRNYQSCKTGKNNARVEKDFLFNRFIEYRQKIQESFAEKSKSLWDQWQPVRLWNFSLIGAILLGMISMALIYKFLGPGALAGDVLKQTASGTAETFSETASSRTPQVLGAAAETVKNDSEENSRYIEELIKGLESDKKEELEKEIRSLVKGYPIEKMLPYIIEKDKIVAAFLISIAKKESDWGKHVPVLQGQDCYNYWGYRGKRKLMGTGGHTCFNSRKDAVDTVAKRIEWLVKNNKLNTPAKMIIWKCGSECHKDDQAAVRKWISDVNIYFNKLNH